ncbi:MAG: radical SAM protein [Candidatus Lokiarchaeota archaeon]
MNNIENLLNKVKNNKIDWKGYRKILTLSEDQMESFYNYSQKVTSKNFNHQLKIYVPGKLFPAISITGTKCALQCEHCNKKYLKGMKNITSEKELENYLFNLHEKGGVGALISGGCEPDGSVPLDRFLKSIKKIKNQTDLIINTHTGFLKDETAEGLADAGIDIVSFDINMDEKILKEIYHLESNTNQYRKAIRILKKYNLNIVPHICVGLLYGELHKEIESLRFIKEMEIDPSLIVIIALIPPESNDFKEPSANDIGKIIALTRFIFPQTEISLGCMRPRKKERIKIEKIAIKAGINRLEIPSKKTLEWFKQEFPDYQLKFISACCAIPMQFEKRAELKNDDLN